jgi:HEAT repeat protein
MKSALAAALQLLFKVRPEEIRRTLLASLYLFTTLGAFITSRISRTVLFLEMPDYKQQLPLIYIGVALSVSLAMLFYGRLETAWRRDQLNTITALILVVVTLLFRLLFINPLPIVYWAYYMWVELLGTLLVIQYWNFVNDIFHSRQAKRLFAFIGGGGIAANIVVGFGIQHIVDRLGSDNLLFVVCGFLLLCALEVWLLAKDAPSDLVSGEKKSPPSKKPISKQAILGTRHVRLIAAVVMICFAVSTVIDYQFQTIIGDSILNKDARSAFLGSFYGYTGIIAGFVQFLFTVRILERFGVMLALALLPLSLLIGSFGFFAVPLMSGLIATTITKGSENVLRYTIYDSTLQLLYIPIPPQLRGRVKALIDGVLKPIAIGGAGLLIALFVGKIEQLTHLSLGLHLNSYQLNGLVLLGLFFWFLALLGVRNEYVKSLVQTLKKRRFNLADVRYRIADEETLKILHKALTGPNIADALHALELLPLVDPKARVALDKEVPQLLDQRNEALRVAALEYLRTITTTNSDAIQKLLHDDSPNVRAAAALAFCALNHEQSIRTVQILLTDASSKVRAAVIAGLIRYAGFDGILSCADKLKAMLASPHDEERAQAAWVLGEVGVKNFYQPLIPLLNDPSRHVCVEAIAAAERLGTRELVPSLISQLDKPQVAGAAISALAVHGASIIDTMATLLKSSEKASAVKAQACRVLGRVMEEKSTSLLLDCLLHPSIHVRSSAAQSLIMIRKKTSGLRLDSARIVHALRTEAEHYFYFLAIADDLLLESNHAVLLNDALKHRAQISQSQILHLLALLHSPETIDIVDRNIHSSQISLRANAVEVLDNLVSKAMKPYLIPIFDDARPADKLKSVSTLMGFTRLSREARLRALIHSDDQWLGICAAMAAADWQLVSLEPDIETMFDAPNPVARQTALVAFARLKSRDLRRKISRLLSDPVSSVRRYAEFLAK